MIWTYLSSKFPRHLSPRGGGGTSGLGPLDIPGGPKGFGGPRDLKTPKRSKGKGGSPPPPIKPKIKIALGEIKTLDYILGVTRKIVPIIG